MFPFIEQPGNDFIVQKAAKFPDRLIDFACISPWTKNVISKIERAVKKLKLKGLKLHPLLHVLHGFTIDNHDLMDPIFEKY